MWLFPFFSITCLPVHNLIYDERQYDLIAQENLYQRLASSLTSEKSKFHIITKLFVISLLSAITKLFWSNFYLDDNRDIFNDIMQVVHQ